jgi:hypothetical protein
MKCILHLWLGQKTLWLRVKNLKLLKNEAYGTTNATKWMRIIESLKPQVVFNLSISLEKTMKENIFEPYE